MTNAPNDGSSNVPELRDFLFVGGTGLIGSSAIKEALAQNKSLTCISRKVNRNNVKSLSLDIGKDRVTIAQEALTSNITVICSGLSNVDANNSELSYYYKSELALIQLFMQLGVRFLYISSNRVLQVNSESDFVNFSTSMKRYINHKLEVETLLNDYDNRILLRIGKVIHPQFPRFLEWIDKYKNFEAIAVPKGIEFEPVTSTDLAKLIILLGKQNNDLTINFWAKIPISYYDSCQIFLSKLYDFNQVYQKLCDSNESLPGVNIPPDLELLTQLNFEVFTSREYIQQVVTQFKRESNLKI